MPDPNLADRLLQGDRTAVPEALNLIDDRRPERRAAALELLDALAAGPHAHDARRVGITGPPGVGKSTLLDALVRELRGRGETVGIIAVDPSSQRTGGALLGDRARVRASATDPGVFLRSMAARERLGGLADATCAGIQVLASLFDWVFVETVGVGQSEVEVAALVDSLVFVAQPSAGDMLQFMKAGLMELPDIFLVNKADTGAPAQRTAAELRSGLELGERTDAAWHPPVLLASARDGEGIAELLEALDRHRCALQEDGGLDRRRRRGRLAYLRDSLEQRYGTYGLERIGGLAGLEERFETDTDGSVFSLARRLSSQIEGALAR